MLLNMIHSILQDMASYSIDETKCTRMISPKSSCDKCIKACPLSCIHIVDGIQMSDSCINCGICSQACPTHAVKMKLETWDYIIHGINSKEHFSLGCKRNPGKNPAYFKDFCLGSLPDEYILFLLLKNPSIINNFDSSNCTHCELFSGFKDFTQRKRTLEEQLSKLRLSPIADGQPHTREMEIEEYDTDKRAFLKSFVNIRETLQNIDESQNTQIFFKLYRKLLKEYPRLYGILPITFPQKSGNCSHCEACSKLCPSKALTYTSSAITLQPFCCSSCGLCCDVCYDKAIEMHPVSLEDFLTDTIQII